MSVGKIRQYIPEGSTTIFEAAQREGKTLAAVIWALDAFQHGRKIFSTIQLGFPYEPLNFSDVKLADGQSKFWGGHIFIDELNFFFGGRRSMSNENVEFAAALLQQKKQGCNLTGTTHNILDLDVILREHHDYLVHPRVYPAYPEPPVVIKLEIDTGPLQRYRPTKTLTLDCRPFLELYDTFMVHDPFQHKAQKRASVGRRVDLAG